MKKRVMSIAAFLILGVSYINANNCNNELFSVTIKKELSIADAIDSITDTCNLSVIVKDVAAQAKLKKKLYYIKLNKVTLKTFLDTILKENNLNYQLIGNKLIISYLTTKTFKVHYIASQRGGSSNSNVNIASAGGVNGNKVSQSSGISIQSNDDFKFWSKLKQEIHQILVSSGDGSLNFVKKGSYWVGPNGDQWQFNPLEPIIDKEGGLITVTGTPQQLKRVQQYLSSLASQLKQQVMIDVQILSVTLNKDKTTGIDWAKLTSIPKFNIDYDSSSNTKAFKVSANASIEDIIKFLKTQGSVKSVSNPKVMTLNNQPALISVGKEIFYKMTTATSNGVNGNTATSEKIDSVFAGILLDITPEIDKRGFITLKINPSITETADNSKGTTTRTMPPDLIRKQISTVIKVKNGTHAILGGLISTHEVHTHTKVPLLGDIPLIGEAFKREYKAKKTEELVVIITPKIVNIKNNLTLKSLGYRNIKK